MKYFTLLLILFTLNFVLSQTTSRGAEASNNNPTNVGKTHAIIIGVSDYDSLPDKKLEYADDDAQLFEKYISSQGDVSCKVFINQKAALRNEIGSALRTTLLNEAQSGDHVIIFFAGHGDTEDDNGYLLLNSAKPSNDYGYEFNETISLVELRYYIEKAEKKGVKTTLIADACKSGSIINSISNISSKTTIMVSCQNEEVAIESSKFGGGHGVFSYYLIQGMMGLADADNSGEVTVKELQRYVEDEVAKETNDKQNPFFFPSTSAPIANVNKELQEKAKREQNAMLNLASIDRPRSMSNSNSLLSATALSFMTLLQDLSVENHFFKDELSTTISNPIQFGTSKSKKIHSGSVSQVTASRNGQYLASCSEDGIQFYKDANFQNSAKLKGHKSGVRCIDFSPSSIYLASGGYDNSVILWDCSKLTKSNTLSGLSGNISSVKFLSEVLVVIGVDNGDIFLWDLIKNTKELVKLHSRRINDFEFVNNILYSASSDGTISRFDVLSKNKMESIKAHNAEAQALRFLALSNSLLSVGYDGKLRQWDIETGKQIFEIHLGHPGLNDVDVDPFEQYCFVGSKSYKLDILDLNTKREINCGLTNTRGIPSLTYLSTVGSLFIGDYGGQLVQFDIKVKPSLVSAVEVHEKLSKMKEVESVLYKIDGTLIIGLNNYVTKILNKLVNGDANVPTISELEKARRYAKKAAEVGSRYEDPLSKLQIHILLLDIFQILMLNQTEKYALGIEKIKQIDKLDPSRAYSNNIAGILYARMDQMDLAKKSAGQAEIHAPLWAEAPCGSGKILFKEGNYLEAEKKFKETIDKGPDLSKGYFNLGKFYMYMGKLEVAKENLEKAISIDPAVDIIQSANSEVLFKLGKESDAFNLALSLNEQTVNPEVLITKGDILCLQKKQKLNYEELHKYYLNALKLDSSNSEAWSSLGYFYLRLIDDKNAKEYITNTFPGTKQTPAEKGLRLKCKELFLMAKRLNSKNLKAQTGYWLSLAIQAEASSVKSLIESNKNSAEVYYRVGRYYHRKGEYKTALGYYKKSISSEEGYVLAYLASMECNSLIGSESKNLKIEALMIKNGIDSKVLSFKDFLLEWEKLW